MKEGDESRIDERLRGDAEALTREVDEFDVAAFARRVIASVETLTSVDSGASVSGRSSVGAARHGLGWLPGTVTGTEATRVLEVAHSDDTEVSPSVGLDVADELRSCMNRATSEGPGGASSARRAAELLELAGDDDQAAIWWRRAAALGDPDAIDYLQGILRQSCDQPIPAPEGGREHVRT